MRLNKKARQNDVEKFIFDELSKTAICDLYNNRDMPAYRYYREFFNRYGFIFIYKNKVRLDNIVRKLLDFDSNVNDYGYYVDAGTVTVENKNTVALGETHINLYLKNTSDKVKGYYVGSMYGGSIDVHTEGLIEVIYGTCESTINFIGGNPDLKFWNIESIDVVGDSSTKYFDDNNTPQEIPKERKMI
jgi:hypothetical protein